MKKYRPETQKRREPSPRRLAAQPERREPSRSSIVFGVLPVIEALKAETRGVDRVLIAEGAHMARLTDVIELCRARSIPWSKVPRETLARQAGDGANTQGVLAVVTAAAYVEADDIVSQSSATPLYLILDGVEDPRNLGAILRTAECAGVDGVFIPDRRAVGLNDTVAKSSAGAIEYVKVAKVTNLNRLIDELKARGVWVIGTSATAEIDHTKWDWTRPSALVLGAEGSGLHRLVAENCDALVKVPMYGRIDSLNVSVAAGVVLFEARRQRAGANS
jgi:23S rRNA (guanosine2251-2'-O)-methyltransferase